MSFFTARSLPWLGFGLLLVSVIALLCCGIAGMGRSVAFEFNFDGIAFYVSGHAWLEGLNPYNFAELEQCAKLLHLVVSDRPLLYPPPSAALFIPLALLPYPVAALVQLFVNLVSLGWIAYLSALWIRERATTPLGQFGQWVVPAIALGSPFARWGVWLGQTSFPAFAVTLAAWTLSRREQWFWSGICLGVATFKPQVCILVVLWFLLEQRWKTLSIAFITSTLMSLYPLMRDGLGTWRDWYDGIIATTTAPDTIMVTKLGLASLIQAAGLPEVNLFFVGITLTGLLWVWRKRFRAEDTFAVLIAIGLIFSGLFSAYDYIMVIVLLVSLWIYCCQSPRLWQFVVPLTLLTMIPSRLVNLLQIPVLNHWRIVMISILLVITLQYSRSHQTKFQLSCMTLRS